jgi:tubulin gamma
MICYLSPLPQLFERVIKEFDLLYKKLAFIDSYRKEKMFADGLEEFDESREVVASLVEEYQACEQDSYPQYGSSGAGPDSFST